MSLLVWHACQWAREIPSQTRWKGRADTQGCPLTSACIPWHAHTSHTQTNQCFKKENFQNIWKCWYCVRLCGFIWLLYHLNLDFSSSCGVSYCHVHSCAHSPTPANRQIAVPNTTKLAVGVREFWVSAFDFLETPPSLAFVIYFFCLLFFLKSEVCPFGPSS